MLSIKNISKSYKAKKGAVNKVLDNVSIDFPTNGMIFLLGRSGSGKSTLLNMIGGLDKPDEGEIIIKGKSSKEFTTTDFDSYRNTFIGFIFQEYNILNEFNVEQNIGLALQLQGKKAEPSKIAAILDQVDLNGFEKRSPRNLSGGEKQRIAIARALIKEPQILMADEPTGALDSKSGILVFDTLKKLSKEKLVIVVSHDREFAKQYGDRIIELKDGKIISDTSKEYLQAKNKCENYVIGDDGIIQINDGSKLSASDFKKINDQIKKSGKVIISNKEENNADIRKVLKINEDGSSEVFNPTTKVVQNKYDPTQTSFIKSRMPILRAIRMGASSLKLKPVRLVFTILLSAISFTMFGVCSTFMLYDSSYSVGEAVKETEYNTGSINKNYEYSNTRIIYNYLDNSVTTDKSSSSNSRTFFGIDELNALNKSNSDRFAGIFYVNSNNLGTYNQRSIEIYDGDTSTVITVDSSLSNYEYYKYNIIDGFSDCGATYANKNFERKAGEYPTDSSHIAISTYTADLILKATGKTSYQDIIDSQKIKLSKNSKYGLFEVTLNISGVYKVEDVPSKYSKLEDGTVEQADKSTLTASFQKYITSGLHLVGFVSDDFYTNTAYNEHLKPVITNKYTSAPTVKINGVRVQNSEISGSVADTDISNVCDKQILDAFKQKCIFYDTSDKIVSYENLNLGEYDCILPTSMKNNNLYYKDSNGNSGKFNVKGYFENSGSNPILHPNFTKKYVKSGNDEIKATVYISDYDAPNDVKYSNISFKTSYSKSDIKLMNKQYSNYYYEMSNDEYVTAKKIVDTISGFNTIFLILGGITGGFSALLLVNFISVSISNKKKEIGILRAIGAKGGDVFKIFYSETSIIALICFAISSIASGVISYFINKSLSEEFAAYTGGVTIGVINFNILNILIILGVSIVITFIATFIPVMIASKKPPVEAIRSL